MTELKDEHFEVISKNKQKAHEERQNMRDQLAFFVLNCNSFDLMKLYDEFKRLKRDKTVK